jgi:16S rRNA (guanine527-N7)-methyltransferase
MRVYNSNYQHTAPNGAIKNVASSAFIVACYCGFTGESIVREEFVNAIKSNQIAFGLEMSDDTIARLADYYELVQQHNPILHLVAPCSPEEFATRHILESLTLLKHLPNRASFADIGPGAGLPSIPCLIAREDLRAVLIESKEKKTGFLRSVVAECKLSDRATIINSQFSETKRPDVSFVTCRALDRFSEKLPQLLKWSGYCTLLFFGGPALRDELRRLGLRPKEFLMPFSERRFLFIAKR